LHQFTHDHADRILAVELLIGDYHLHLAVHLFVKDVSSLLESGQSGFEQLFVESYRAEQLVSSGIFELLLVVIDDALFDLAKFIT